ncbi:hypothetical protein DSCW_48700 [Desulfosarcina widdelii]|uniref:Uncharacterized protein n=1 Tax=Desulfosarcina widdelii TaxID=947919 RepID=A0A5K7ZCJ3_9BACT|nr:hypothetical protein DSCW_48700 [Desulfosarcina widdelii]
MDSPTWAIIQDVVYDGNNIGQAFAGTCTCCQNIVVAFGCNLCGLGLVFVKPQGHSISVNPCIAFTLAEDLGTNLVKDSVFHQFVNRFPEFKRWIELDQGVRPQKPGIQFLFNLLGYARVKDMDEAFYKIRVIFNETVTQPEHVHDGPP